jgi:hypothetical protein
LLFTSLIMTNFKGLKDLFNMLKVKHILKKHWSDFVGWGIVKSMNDLSLDILDFYAFVCCLRMKLAPFLVFVHKFGV